MVIKFLKCYVDSCTRTSGSFPQTPQCGSLMHWDAFYFMLTGCVLFLVID
uniref:Uncharacterized protein n=1 Tax=Rhizophora mucronata TaxID=61149 RepID=A0A2P2QBY4_RHIMU